MKIIFDDTYHYIESEKDELFKCKHDYEFKDVLDILLTTKQYHEFVADCRNREFEVSEARIKKATHWINSDDNIWRKKR